MKRSLSRKSGFTLAEVVISCVLLLIAFLSFGAVMYTQGHFISYSRHKLQAIYLTRAVMDLERLTPFSGIVNQAFMPNGYSGYDLNNANIVVTVLAPYNDAAMTYRKTVRVGVTWNEHFALGANRTEFLTTDITNDPQLN